MGVLYEYSGTEKRKICESLTACCASYMITNIHFLPFRVVYIKDLIIKLLYSACNSREFYVWNNMWQCLNAVCS